MTKVEIIAHRGESAGAPENTMAAFRLAWTNHVRAIELDVHLTKDDELVVLHDADTLRTTGVFLRASESTSAELRRLDAGAWRGAQWAGEPIPTLDEVLEELPSGVRCYIELKDGPHSVPALVRSLEKAGLPEEQIVLISFHAGTLAEAKRRIPRYRAFFLALFQRSAGGDWTPSAEALIGVAKGLSADGLDLCFDGPIDRAFVQQVKTAGLGLCVWTVDDLETAQRMAEAGVNGITTNRAVSMRQEFEDER